MSGKHKKRFDRIEKDCLEAVLKASYYEESGGRVREYMQPDVEIVDALGPDLVASGVDLDVLESGES